MSEWNIVLAGRLKESEDGFKKLKDMGLMRQDEWRWAFQDKIREIAELSDKFIRRSEEHSEEKEGWIQAQLVAAANAEKAKEAAVLERTRQCQKGMNKVNKALTLQVRQAEQREMILLSRLDLLRRCKLRLGEAVEGRVPRGRRVVMRRWEGGEEEEEGENDGK